jgi:hypothetical protein
MEGISSMEQIYSSIAIILEISISSPYKNTDNFGIF